MLIYASSFGFGFLDDNELCTFLAGFLANKYISMKLLSLMHALPKIWLGWLPLMAVHAMDNYVVLPGAAENGQSSPIKGAQSSGKLFGNTPSQGGTEMSST